jgi:TPR repeat protein
MKIIPLNITMRTPRFLKSAIKCVLVMAGFMYGNYTYAASLDPLEAGVAAFRQGNFTRARDVFEEYRDADGEEGTQAKIYMFAMRDVVTVKPPEAVIRGILSKSSEDPLFEILEARLHLLGFHPKADPKKGLKTIKGLDEEGYASYTLGLYYEGKLGGTRDLKKAYTYYGMARDAEYQQALTRLREIGPELDRLEGAGAGGDEGFDEDEDDSISKFMSQGGAGKKPSRAKGGDADAGWDSVSTLRGKYDITDTGSRLEEGSAYTDMRQTQVRAGKKPARANGRDDDAGWDSSSTLRGKYDVVDSGSALEEGSTYKDMRQTQVRAGKKPSPRLGALYEERDDSDEDEDQSTRSNPKTVRSGVSGSSASAAVEAAKREAEVASRVQQEREAGATALAAEKARVAQLEAAHQAAVERMAQLEERARTERAVGMTNKFYESVATFGNLESLAKLEGEASKGDCIAQGYLSVLYAVDRTNLKKDLEKAGFYATRSIAAIRAEVDKNNCYAQWILGRMYEMGIGVHKDNIEAVKWFRKAAEQGYAVAQFNLGLMYGNGMGVDKDEREAVQWFRKAAEQGNAAAQKTLGFLYENGRGVDKDDREAVQWYRKAADQGHSVAQHNLGKLYANGMGVDQNYREAAQLYRKAADQGYAVAQYALGWMYGNGRGVDKDDREAVQWYRKAADQGYAEAIETLKLRSAAEAEAAAKAQEDITNKLYEFVRLFGDKAALEKLGGAADKGDFMAQGYLSILYTVSDNDKPKKDLKKAHAYATRGIDRIKAEASKDNPYAQWILGRMHQEGIGDLPKNDKEAFRLYQRSAQQGHAVAQNNLGLMYGNGMGVDKDEREAVQWCRKAADQGYALAQYVLGTMYANGMGVDKDEREAVQWYRKAADQGLAAAQYALGWMYDSGRGVDKDEREAVQWYRKAADQGYADAQYVLGTMYANGMGVDKDEREAIVWFRKAADQGHSVAQHNLGKLYANGMGVDQNYREAVQWYRKAADQGYAVAQYDLGRMYANGMGVDKDEREAVQWYRKAADQGYADAQYVLGRMYANGMGVDKDEREAIVWFRKAADQGYAGAQNALGAMGAAEEAARARATAPTGGSAWAASAAGAAAMMPVPPAVPYIALGHEAFYRRLFAGRLEYRPTEGSDVGLVVLPIADLLRPIAGSANPLSATFDLSRCGDAWKYLSINIGYKKAINGANKDKTEIWICPKFLAERELDTFKIGGGIFSKPKHPFAKIMDGWEAPVGYFWTWGGYDVESDNYDYLLAGIVMKNDENLYDKWWRGHHSFSEAYSPLALLMRLGSFYSIMVQKISCYI